MNQWLKRAVTQISVGVMERVCDGEKDLLLVPVVGRLLTRLILNTVRVPGVFPGGV